MATGIKTGGRSIGTLNKDTAEIRNSFKNLIENNLEQIQKDFKELDPKDRIKAILDLAKFVIPLLKAVEVNDATNQNGFNPIIINL